MMTNMATDLTSATSASASATDIPSTGPAAIVGQPLTHDSAVLHVTGRARFTDDIPVPANCLHAAFGVSPVAHGHVRLLDLAAVRAAPGVAAVITAADIPGHNNYGPILADDPILASDMVHYAGQPLFVVAATSMLAARRAVRLAKIDIEALPAILDIRSALAADSKVLPTETLRRGDPQAALLAAPHRLAGSIVMGGQDHFYLEGQIALALPQEAGGMLVHCSTQHPTEIQHRVAEALGCAVHEVVVHCRRMGGGFGGKESQPALLACSAAVLAARTGRAVKLRLERDADMTITGKRHDFLADYEVGFDDAGRILGLTVMLASRCGHSADLSGPVNDRALFHIDNAYFLEHIEVASHRCRTHTVSNTAFRGFGGPQGMLVIETMLDDIARHLRRDALDVRRANFYGIDTRNVTPYQQTVEGNVIGHIVDQLEASSDYRARRTRIQVANASSPVIKRGLALTPVKFGISFNAVWFNQAGALLHVYTDGSVLLNHGGTEMGQGLYTKVSQVVAETLGVSIDRVRTSATDTSKVPNTSATAASSGSDLNGKAAEAAALTLRERLTAFAAQHYEVATQDIRFAHNTVYLGDRTLPFPDLIAAAYMARIPLSATGFYRTPKIHYDRKTLSGKPFFYYAWGAAVSEVAMDTLTGETRLLRLDILHDVGRSLNPAIDLGQIEGGFLQGMGWLTSEELWWNPHGQLQTHAPSTYKIPTAYDWPLDARIALFDADNPEDTIHRSKAVGEPPLMLAISVFAALRDAVAASGIDSSGTDGAPAAPPRVELEAPATPEHILRAVYAQRRAAQASQAARSETPHA